MKWKKNVLKLKRNKTLGIDGIPTHVLQEKSFLVPVWLFISSRRHRRWAKGAMDSTSVFFFASSFAYNFVRK